LSATTRHPHPHLQAAIGNYAGLLMRMGLPESRVLATLNEVLKPIGGIDGL